MRATTVLAFLALTAFACGGTERAPKEATLEATESAGGSNAPPAERSVMFDMSKEPIVGSSTIVPPESEIENEGVVWLEVRTVNTVIDTAWVIVSSGFAEVDEFALFHVMTNIPTMRVGWGDPPFKMKVSVRIPDDINGQEGLATELDTVEVGALPVLAEIPPGSDLKHEGDVLVVLSLVEDLIDTAWVVESSGNSEVDGFALNHVMTMNQTRSPFFRDMDNDSLNARIFVRHQP